MRRRIIVWIAICFVVAFSAAVGIMAFTGEEPDTEPLKQHEEEKSK